MSADSGSWLFLLGSCAVTFFLARKLGAGWRAKRKTRAQEAARAGESRQVRRARQRGQHK